jgi:hypothetical protein
VARYAQACNLFDIPDGGRTVRHKLEVLARHCEAEGRDMADLDKTISTRVSPGETVTEVADRLHVLAGMGLDHAVVITAGPWQPDTLDVLIEASSR